MGLFDIFRRHKKREEQETPSQEPQSAVSATSNGSSAAVVESSQVESQKSATSDVPTSESGETASSVEVTASEQSANSDSAAPVESASASKDDSAAAVSDENSSETDVTEQPAEPEVAGSTESEEESGAVAESNEATVTEPAEAQASEAAAESAAEAEESSAKKYDQGLEKSRTGFGARLNRFLANFRHVDEDFFDDLEDMLIESDVGYDMAMKLSDELREEVKLQNAKSKQEISNVIIEKMVQLYDQAGKDEQSDLNFAQEGPTVIMFVGVNGAGKTTTIGKMAALFKSQGKKVLLAAADTFRAGATEQLDVWAKRDGVDIVTGPENGDPAAVVFDAVQKAKKEDYDILFVDTAGRLQNKVNLMKELAKMKRILTREIPDAPHEVLLVLDATTGQNALNQAKLFKESTDVTGIVLTKLDGTARGGIVLAIRNELHLPVKYVGLGEKVNDLQKFDASEFVYGLFKGLVEVD